MSKSYVSVLLIHLTFTNLRSSSSSGQARASRGDAADDVARAGLTGELRHGSDLGVPAVGEVGAELLALLKTALDAGGAHGAQAVVGVAGLGRALLELAALDEEGTTLDGVDEDVARLEATVRVPRAGELDETVTVDLVILRVGVEEADLADGVASRVLGHGRDIVDTHTRAVAGLEDVVTPLVLVVVNTLVGTLVKSGLLGVLEITDIPDVGDGVAVGGGAGKLVLVVLVVHEEPLLVVDIVNPALVGEGGAFVGDSGDDGDIALVGNIEAKKKYYEHTCM